MPSKLHAQLVALALVALVALVGCSGSDDGSEATATTRPARATSSTLPPGPVFDWAAPKPTDLGGGFAVEDCDGDAPFFCVRKDGAIVGVLEALSFADEGKTLEQHAQEYFRSTAADRREGCGTSYQFEEDPIVDVGPAVRYSFTGTAVTDSLQPSSERIVHYAVRDRDRLRILAASSLDEGACLAREGEFTPAVLRQFEPRLDALVRRNGVPRFD